MIKPSEVPEDWDIKSIGEVSKVVYGDGLPKRERNGGDVPVYGSGGISGYHDECLEDTSVVILGRKGSINEVHYVDEPFWAIDTTYYLDSNEQIDTKYLYYFFDMYDLERLDASGTIPSLRKGDIIDLDIPVPPLDEQERIVEAVEERLERVERLEKSIQSVRRLSTEYESSIMAYIFSNLDLNSKESAKNLPEAEDIPDSWKLTTLGDMAHFQNGNGFSKSQWEDEGKPIIRIQNLTGTGDSYNYFSGEVHDRYAVENGDILFSWSGTIDAFRWTGGDAWLNQHIYRVDAEDGVEKKYLFYLLKRCANILEKRKVGGTLQHIRKGDVTGLQVPLPPKQEQYNIVEKLESVDFSTLEKGVTDINELLTEYRESILSRAFQDTPKADL